MGQSQQKKTMPAQHQEHQPGFESEMDPAPEFCPIYPGVGKFKEQAILITGGDSGIGKAVSLAFANEGANIAIIYKEEASDAFETKKLVESFGGQCLLIEGDIGEETFCQKAVKKTFEHFGRLDVLINNAGEQHQTKSISDITSEQLITTFKTNIFSFFYLAKAALNYLPSHGGSIINTASVTAYRGSPDLLDYSSTKGAIVTFTRSLAKQLAKKKIRVNAVAPGPIWTPLIVSSFDEKKVEQFGSQVPMGRPGQPQEVAGAYTFLASQEASYITGQVIHVNGGEIINT